MNALERLSEMKCALWKYALKFGWNSYKKLRGDDKNAQGIQNKGFFVEMIHDIHNSENMKVRGVT